MITRSQNEQHIVSKNNPLEIRFRYVRTNLNETRDDIDIITVYIFSIAFGILGFGYLCNACDTAHFGISNINVGRDSNVYF